MKAPSVRPVRCAIYTRVSTEHGLDQEFNSLDAQAKWVVLAPHQELRRPGEGMIATHACGGVATSAGSPPGHGKMVRISCQLDILPNGIKQKGAHILNPSHDSKPCRLAHPDREAPVLDSLFSVYGSRPVHELPSQGLQFLGRIAVSYTAG
jgi:hypothetical protein